MRELKIREALQVASYVRKRFDEDGIVEYEAKKKLEDLAYEYGIGVYFDEDDIPEQVEDSPV